MRVTSLLVAIAFLAFPSLVWAQNATPNYTPSPCYQEFRNADIYFSINVDNGTRARLWVGHCRALDSTTFVLQAMSPGVTMRAGRFVQIHFADGTAERAELVLAEDRSIQFEDKGGRLWERMRAGTFYIEASAVQLSEPLPQMQGRFMFNVEQPAPAPRRPQ